MLTSPAHPLLQCHCAVQVWWVSTGTAMCKVTETRVSRVIQGPREPKSICGSQDCEDIPVTAEASGELLTKVKEDDGILSLGQGQYCRDDDRYLPKSTLVYRRTLATYVGHDRRQNVIYCQGKMDYVK